MSLPVFFSVASPASKYLCSSKHNSSGLFSLAHGHNLGFDYHLYALFPLYASAIAHVTSYLLNISCWMFQAFLKLKRLKTIFLGFPGGSVAKKSALQCKGHPGLIPGPGRFHMLRSNQVCVPQLLSPWAATTEASMLQQEKPPKQNEKLSRTQQSLVPTLRYGNSLPEAKKTPNFFQARLPRELSKRSFNAKKLSLAPYNSSSTPEWFLSLKSPSGFFLLLGQKLTPLKWPQRPCTIHYIPVYPVSSTAPHSSLWPKHSALLAFHYCCCLVAELCPILWSHEL